MRTARNQRNGDSVYPYRHHHHDVGEMSLLYSAGLR